jgi:nitrite reductase (NO-forming)
MTRSRIAFLALAALAAVLVWALPAGAQSSTKKVTAVTVLAGKPNEFGFKLSKTRVPKGVVVFTVKNMGAIPHDFKIAGKKTRSILPGKRTTLRVVIKKKGRYSYLCTLLGHAAAGMKGKLAVGTTPAPTTTTGTSTTTTTTTTTGTTTGTVGNTASTIAVGMFEYRFDLVPATVPSGPITFVITNRGAEVHNFSISGVKSGAFINPGGSETWTVGLPAGRYDFVCDVPFHIGAGMTGTLVVTP